MVSILNVNPDIYINCKHELFRKNFINNHNLRPGDIIGVIKNTLKNCFIIGKNNSIIENCIKNNKFLITIQITDIIKNPVLYYKSISYLIDSIEFKATHICFKKLLDFNEYENLKIIYKYSKSRNLLITNSENAIYKYKMDSLIYKDNLLIFILDNLSKEYITIKKKFILSIFNIDKFIIKLKKNILLYWNMSSYKQKATNNEYELEFEVKLPKCELELFNSKFT